jgi:hypothetical protein
MSNQQKVTALSFDASGIAPQKPIECIPAGWYPCEISDAEVKATKGRSGGKRANFEFTVTAGDYKGRKIFGGINVTNANPQAQEIGQRELSAICHAVGIINVSDLAAFIGKQLHVKVKLKKATPEEVEKGYEDRNEPSGFKALEGAAVVAGPPVGGPPPIAQTPPSAPAPAVPAAPAPVAEFPPAGWVAHPSAPGYFWNQSTNEVKAEAELRALIPAAPVPAPAPVAPPMPPAAPPVAPAPPVVAFPPAGWVVHPSAPGWFYEVANPANMKEEADLKAMSSAPAPVVPAGPPAPPVVPAAGSPPPWKTQG